MIRFSNTLINEKEVAACVLDPDGNQHITVYLNGGHKIEFSGGLADRIWEYLGGFNLEADESREVKASD